MSQPHILIGSISNRTLLASDARIVPCYAKIWVGSETRRANGRCAKQEIRTSTLSETLSTNARIMKQIDGRQTIGRPQSLVKDELVTEWENAFCPLIVL